MSKEDEAVLFSPRHELGDDVLIEQVNFPSRMKSALTARHLRTIGDVRNTPEPVLLGIHNLGRSSVKFLRRALGLAPKKGGGPKN